MKQSAKAITLTGFAGATAFAGATQSYGTIINVQPPSNIAGVTPSGNASTKEFWDIDTGTTSATSKAASDIEFGYLNSSTYNESFTGVYALHGGSTNAYYASNGTHYAYARAQRLGDRDGGSLCLFSVYDLFHHHVPDLQRDGVRHPETEQCGLRWFPVQGGGWPDS